MHIHGSEGGSEAGAGFVWFGGSSGLPSATTSGSADIRLVGESFYDYCGKEVSGVPDMDGDGTDELLLGCYGWDDGMSSGGGAFVFLGPVTAGAYTASEANFWLEGQTSNAYLGHSVTGLDFNGDGKGDMAAGAYGAGSYAGAVHVVFGAEGLGLGI